MAAAIRHLAAEEGDAFPQPGYIGLFTQDGPLQNEIITALPVGQGGRVDVSVQLFSSMFFKHV